MYAYEASKAHSNSDFEHCTIISILSLEFYFSKALWYCCSLWSIKSSSTIFSWQPLQRKLNKIFNFSPHLHTAHSEIPFSILSKNQMFSYLLHNLIIYSLCWGARNINCLSVPNIKYFSSFFKICSKNKFSDLTCLLLRVFHYAMIEKFINFRNAPSRTPISSIII